MNETEKMAAEFRAGVQEQAGKGPRNRYTAALRELATRYWKVRKAEGASPATAAGELGIDDRSLLRWARAATSRGSRFRRVEVLPDKEPSSRAGRGYVLHGPGGVRVEGLDMDALAALLRRLR